MKTSLALSLLAVLAIHASADTITLRADEWCPYNCDPKSDKPGYMIEIAKAVFEKAGHKVDYQTLPWTRTLREVENGVFDGAVGAARGDAENFVFSESNLGLASSTFFVQKDDTWNYEGIASLEKINLGVIRGYSYGDELDSYIEANKDKPTKVQVASGDNALQTNFKKLSVKRMDAVVENANVADFKLKEMGMEGKFRKAGKLEPDEVYIAFSPAKETSKTYAKLLDDGIEELRKSGELAKILDKYGLKDWK